MIAAAVESRREEILAGLQEFVRHRSVSTDPSCAEAMEECAAWLLEHGRSLGLEGRLEPTPGPPCVLLRGPEVPGAPRVLVYGHYDVQPAEDLERWSVPPFEARVADGRIHGRGACDNKGQLWTHLAALGLLLEERGSLPVNVTVLVEGEEETASPNLAAVLERLAPELRPDLAVVSDTSSPVKGLPIVHYSLRGGVFFEVRLRTAARDVHSGIFGGTLANATQTLCALVARLHDDRHRVTIPGFYEGVRPMEPWEREALEAIPFDEESYRQWLGTPRLVGEAGFSTNERRWFRPTMECNGIWGGYQGEGSKTIVPAAAGAKFAARLVADQDPRTVMDRVAAWFRAECPQSADVEVLEGNLARPYLLEREGLGERLLEAARGAAREGFGVEPLYSRHGGTVPIVSEFQRILGVPTLLLGFGSPDDGVHSYDEKFELANLFAGIRTVAALMDRLGGR